MTISSKKCACLADFVLFFFLLSDLFHRCYFSMFITSLFSHTQAAWRFECIFLFCRWIKHHYFAMAMALISLTWEIEKGPDCSQKQVFCPFCFNSHTNQSTNPSTQKFIFIYEGLLVSSVIIIIFSLFSSSLFSDH